MPDDFVALLPLRGGSRGIPGKNIKQIAGKPLCFWTLAAAAKCSLISSVYVSTDSPLIADVVLNLGLGVNVIERPAEFATDTASTESVMMHFAQKVQFQNLITMQATSPLLTCDDLERAIGQYQDHHLDSLLTAVRVKRFFWTPSSEPLNYDPRQRPRRQDFAGTFMENGAFYVTRRSVLERERCRLGGRMEVFEMSEDTAIELDSPDDWNLVEAALLARQRRHMSEIIRDIKLVIVDVDGTLTDGGMYYSGEGEQLKRFDTRDARGLHDLRDAGVEVVVVTTEESLVAEARCQKLKIPCYRGIEDKREFVLNFCQERGITPAAVAMIGDDVNDVAVMQACGLAFCPRDAQPEVRRVCAYVAQALGGHGAVREICRLILAGKSQPQEVFLTRNET